MCSGEFSIGKAFGLGYIKPINQPWRPVIYTVVDNMAIVEGCIVLGPLEDVERTARDLAQHPLAFADPDYEHLGSAILGAQFRWTSLEIPYSIETGFPRRERVTDAIAHWQSKTPFRFKEAEVSNHHIIFASGDGCSSRVGMQSSAQTITLGAGCTTGNAIHEIGHALGLWHEQSRIDRDSKIKVLWENIIPAARHNFEQHLSDGIDVGDYDYESIMHYPADAFGIGGRQTIQPLQVGARIGQRDGLSAGDVASIEEIYKDLITNARA